LYLETEEVDKSILEELKKLAGKKDDEETKIVRRLADHEIYAQMYNEKTDEFAPSAYQKSGPSTLKNLHAWDSRKCALALYTVN